MFTNKLNCSVYFGQSIGLSTHRNNPTCSALSPKTGNKPEAACPVVSLVPCQYARQHQAGETTSKTPSTIGHELQTQRNPSDNRLRVEVKTDSAVRYAVRVMSFVY